MEAFDQLEHLIQQAGKEMHKQGLKEFEVDMNMVLVEPDSEEEKKHQKKGASLLSVHTVDGKQFVLYSS